MNAARSPAAAFAAGPCKNLRRFNAFIFQRRQAARKDRLADQSNRLAEIERADDRPLARALLAGGVENLVDDRLAVFVLFGKDLAGDFDQVTVQLALVPLGKDLVQLIGVKAKPALQQVVGLADQLHIAVLDAVVNHLDVVAGAVFAHPVAAGRSVFDLGGDGLEDGFHVRPCGRIAAGHDGWAEARALFAAGDAGADKQNAFCGQIFGAAIGVGKQRVTAVDDDVARFKIGQHMVDRLVNGVARLDHQHDAPRPLEQAGKLLDGVRAHNLAFPWLRWPGSRPLWRRCG